MNNNKDSNFWYKLLYYLVLVLSGIAIYFFQIERSFNLPAVYIAVIIILSIRIFSDIYNKYLLALIFLCLLYYLYPGIKFLYAFSAIIMALAILLPNYKIGLKIMLISLFGFVLSLIYVVPNDHFTSIKYVPFIVGSLFMFRSISYIHEMRYAKKETPLIDKINYFLLLPNLSMPLFPIVDFKDFAASYSSLHFHQLQRGTLFVIKGIMQLLLYRFIYHYMIESIASIQDAADVFLYVCSNFLIVLRVIGAYHISIGLIILCGYSVPDLFNNIFFATGFSDLWRRTNMYWKNFMVKIFYYPFYFKWKKYGEYIGIIMATVTCFAITWILHTYQWFWIKGTFPLQVKDVIFWGVFGVLVAISSVLQQAKLQQKDKKKSNQSSYTFIKNGISGLLVFLTMSILWSIWVAPDMTAWWQLMSKASSINVQVILHLLVYISVYLIAACTYHFYQSKKHLKDHWMPKKLEKLSIYPFVLIIVGLFIAKELSKNTIRYGMLLKPIIYEKLNKADEENVDNGYYTNLINTNDYCTQVWSNNTDYSKNKTRYINQNVTSWTNDLMLFKYIPNKKLLIDGKYFSTNSMGFHDHEYSQVKPFNTYRIIVLGGSYESGNGVADDEDFISLVEKNLNTNYVITRDGVPVKVEIINMAINGYMLLQRMYQYKKYAPLFDPDATLLFLHTNYQHRTINYFKRLLFKKNSVEDAYIAKIIAEKKLKQTDSEEELALKLGSEIDTIIQYAIANIAMMNKEDEVQMVGVYLPALKDKLNSTDLQKFQVYSKELDFPLLNLEGVYDQNKKQGLSISETDFHPNKAGNDLIALKLEESIILHPDIFKLKIAKK